MCVQRRCAGPRRSVLQHHGDRRQAADERRASHHPSRRSDAILVQHDDYFNLDAIQLGNWNQITKPVTTVPLRIVNARSKVGSVADVGVYPANHVEISIPPEAQDGIGLDFKVVLLRRRFSAHGAVRRRPGFEMPSIRPIPSGHSHSDEPRPAQLDHSHRKQPPKWRHPSNSGSRASGPPRS